MSDEVIREIKSRWRGIRPFERHSLVLMVAGAVYVLIGVSYLLIEPTPARLRSLEYALRWADLQAWGVVWVLVGLLSVISSRWPPVSETWGYTVLTGQAAAWSLFFFAGVVFGDSPVSNYNGVLAWGLLAFMWWGISGLVNPNALEKMLARINALQSENLELHAELRRLKEQEE